MTVPVPIDTLPLAEVVPDTSAMFQWFGSNRMLGHAVGQELAGCKWLGVVFAGGMSELAHIKCRTILVNDLHRHAINCARVVADRKLRPEMIRALRRLPFAGDVLEAAQARCALRDAALQRDGLFGEVPDPSLFDRLEWAVDYFVATWMGRGGRAGCHDEFRGGISLRWNASGGDSATRFRSATRSLAEWGRIVGRDGVNFSTLDCFEFLDLCKDLPGHGIYSDAPWPGPGDKYRHKFDERSQRPLAARLESFRHARVVVRFGDHPLIRELYPTSHWHWRMLTGRNQANDDSSEVLILNKPSLMKEVV